MLELTIKHEKCSQVSYKQGKKITQPVSKCKLQKNPTENDNFSHKTATLQLSGKKPTFSASFFYSLHLYIRCMYFFAY